MVATDGNQEVSIGNFTVDVRSEVTIITEAGETPAAKFVIRFDDGSSSDEIIVPLSGPKGLGKLDWYALHPYIQIYPKLGAAQQHLTNDIRAQLPAAPKETVYHLNQLGASIVDGEAVFNTGGGLIRPLPGPLKRPDIIPEPSQYKLDIDPNLSEAEAVKEMMNIVSLSPDAGRVIFSHSLLYTMRKAYEMAWKSPCCILFLYGDTGVRKTTLSAFMTQLHNRNEQIEEPPRLNASIPAAEAIIYEKSDCVIVLDDLFPTGFRDSKAWQEKTLLEVTRIIADGVGRARMRGGKVSKGTPTCGVIFTGEYLIGSGSDAARLLPIELTTPIDSAKLGECQAKPLVVSTFYSFFIQWYIDNFATIQSRLENWWNAYKMKDLGIHGRLQETHFFLNTAYRLFLNYCVEKGFATDDEEQQHARAFKDELTGLVQAQHKRIKQDQINMPTKVDAYKFIRTLYRNDSWRIAKSKKRYSHNPEKFDGLIYGELLCLRREKLLTMFHKTGYSNTSNEIRNALIAKEALWLDGEGKNKKIDNERFFGIYLNKLS